MAETSRKTTFSPRELVSEDTGIAAAIVIPDPQHLAVVWNYKTETALIECAVRNRQSLPNDVADALCRYEKIFAKKAPEHLRVRWSRQAYNCIIRPWAIGQMQKEGIALPKPDKNGLFCGKIWGFERRDYPNDYPVKAMARELAEEGGVESEDEELIWNNLSDSERTHEKWFFWIKRLRANSSGEIPWRKESVKSETRAPEMKLFSALSPRNFYYTHAIPVMVVLAKLVESGKAEYIPALEHMKAEFAQRQPRREKPDALPVVDESTLSDSELFLREMKKINATRR